MANQTDIYPTGIDICSYFHIYQNTISYIFKSIKEILNSCTNIIKYTLLNIPLNEVIISIVILKVSLISLPNVSVPYPKKSQNDSSKGN